MEIAYPFAQISNHHVIHIGQSVIIRLQRVYVCVCACMAFRPRTLRAEFNKRLRTLGPSEDYYLVLPQFDLGNAVILAYKVA